MTASFNRLALNPLERLGFAVLAAQRLRIREGPARLLLALIEADGKPLDAASLAVLIGRRGARVLVSTVRVQACFLREALDDHGFPALPHAGYGRGYRLDPADAAVIFAAVVEGAA